MSAFCCDVQVLEDSRAVLIAADVPPDGPFPQDEKLKDGGSSLLYNPDFSIHHSVAIKFVTMSCSGITALVAILATLA